MNTPYMSLSNISKSFEKSQETIPILKKIDFNINRGESVAIRGSSGSGKSTLLKIMAGVEMPDGGEIFFHDMGHGPWNEMQWAKFRAESLGFIFQDFQLIETMTVKENVDVSLAIRGYHDSEELAKHWLHSVGLSHRFDHFPHQLSGGEMQRVALARAFAAKPTLILADEPTGSVDEHNRDQILMLIRKLMSDSKPALIMVTHDRAVAAIADKEYTLHNGILHNEAV